MTRVVRLRPWQKAALDRFSEAGTPDFLAVATPGAGKTTFALTVARQQLAEHPGRLIVVAPTAHLKVQWARAAAAFSLHLDTAWAAADGRLPADMHGIVTSYQQVATSASLLRKLSNDAFVIFDELHHAADDRAWGDAIRDAFATSRRRLSLSGTPFRSDTRAIPFVNYEGDEAVPDYEYSYGNALADGRVVRPVYFPSTNGQMEWQAPDGSVHSATFDDRLDAQRAAQRLRTALSLEGEWLPTVLRSAHKRLTEVRREQPNAGGLVIAIDQEHARGIAAILKSRFGVNARVVTSDDYIEFKPVYDPAHRLIEQSGDAVEKLLRDLQEARTLETDSFKVIWPPHLMTVLRGEELSQPKGYDWCPTAELRTLVTPTDAYVCPYHRGNPDAGYSVAGKPFAEVWQGAEARAVRRRLNPSVDCTFNCIRHETNLAVLESLRSPASDPRPDYDLFI